MTTQKLVYWAALGVAIVANIGANIALKTAMSNVSAESLNGGFLQVLRQGSFWIGLFFAGILLLCYLFAIKSLPVSIAYIVVTSLAMVGLVLVERQFFGVPLGLDKIFGIVLVSVGVWLISRGA